MCPKTLYVHIYIVGNKAYQSNSTRSTFQVQEIHQDNDTQGGIQKNEILIHVFYLE